MENFIVSARKYRPTTFSSVVGQTHITSTLKNAIATGKLAQAFLFCGPRGVGKTTCARILAKTINCTNPTADMEACDECESCRSFNSGQSMNIFELDAASNNSVDGIRELVEKVRYAPQTGRYKVYIIDEVHMLSSGAFNAFLKTLEEPPEYVKFILATTEKHKILPTILSRCQVFDFKRIMPSDIVAHLASVAKQEGVSYEPAALKLIARKAEGGLRDALSIFDQMVSFTNANLTKELCQKNLNVMDSEYYFRLVDMFKAADVAGVLNLYDEIVANGFEGQQFLTGLSEHLRNLLVSLDVSTQKLLDVDDDERRQYDRQSTECGLALLMRYLEIASDYEYRFRDATNKRLFTEVALSKMSVVTKNLQLAQPAG